MADTTPPPSARRFSPTPVETTVKKVRRFVVEPVETTARSNRREDVQKVEDSTAVEKKVDVPTKRRFIPEPVETTFKSSKQVGNSLPTPEPTPVSIPERPSLQEPPKARRKFVPQLIETSKRSKKAGDTRPATLHTDKVSSIPISLPKHWLITFNLADRSYSWNPKYIHEKEDCASHEHTHKPQFDCTYTNTSFATAKTRFNAAPSQHQTEYETELFPTRFGGHSVFQF